MDEQKRQRLVVGVVAVALVCIGGYEFFDRGVKKGLEDHPSGMDSKQMLTLANRELAPLPESEIAARIFSIIETAWDEEAFVHGKYMTDEIAEKKAESEVSFKIKDFDYSGFLRAGKETIAIINGIDYKAGEVIKDFTIEKITEDFLILSKPGKKVEVKIR